jgi:hypothetical protein
MKKLTLCGDAKMPEEMVQIKISINDKRAVFGFDPAFNTDEGIHACIACMKSIWKIEEKEIARKAAEIPLEKVEESPPENLEVKADDQPSV